MGEFCAFVREVCSRRSRNVFAIRGDGAPPVTILGADATPRHGARRFHTDHETWSNRWMFHRSNIVLLALAAGVFACSADPRDEETPDSGSETTPDAGETPDAGDTPDGGETPDAGETPDGGDTEDPRLHPCGDETPAPDTGRPLPEEVRTGATDVELVGGTRRLEIYARRSKPLTATELADFQERACAALGYNLVEVDASLTAGPLQPAFRIVVLDDTTYGRVTGAAGTYGVAYPNWNGDGDAIVVPKNGLRNVAELDDTLAHELNHVVVGRYAPNDLEIPWWAIEGFAINIGTRFGKLRTGEATGFAGGWIAQADGDDARLTFQRYDIEDNTTNLSQVGHDQSISGFFVEYLRVKYVRPNTTGFGDVGPRMLDAMIHTSESGDPFADGFSSGFGGASLSNAKERYATFLDETAGNNATRLAGTVWE